MTDTGKPAGRTAWDVLWELLNTKFWPTIGTVIVLLIVTAALIILVFRLTPIRKAGPFEVADLDSGVVLRAERGDERQYLLTVAAQGWKSTNIAVEVGDTLEFHASGSVGISLSDIVNLAAERGRLEDSISRVRGIRPERGDTALPERFFDSSLNARIRLPRPWVGPEGDISGSLDDHRFPGRTQHKVLPASPYGSLVGAISVTQRLLNPRKVFEIGVDTVIVVEHRGFLWFTVNDVVWPDNRFFDDNVGSFLVSLRIKGS
jgi:hypothetical protein